MPKAYVFDPDVTRDFDAAYWGAALVLALRAGNRRRAELARRKLLRLGFRFRIISYADRRAARAVGGRR